MKALKKLILSCGLFCSLLSTAFAVRPVVIDTDVGMDDAVAMLYLLNRQDMDVKAITIASTGEAHCKPALRNVAGILQLVGQTQIPLACGRSQPLVGHHQFPQSIRRSADTLAGAADLLPKSKIMSSQSAVNLLANTLQHAAQPIDILEIGPLTNIAELIKKYPDIKKKIRMLYVMGGAVNVRGNLIETDASMKNAVAEWNIYIDPAAADIVFRSGIPITLVALDITNQVPVEIDFYQRVKKLRQGKMTHFFYELFHKDEAEILNHQWYFWDALAAVITSDDSIVTTTPKKLRVVLNPEDLSGATIVDKKNGHLVRVCTALKEKKRFEKMLLNTIKSGDK